MNWTEMQQATFDKSLKRQREIIETAPDTLFPELMPPVIRNPGASVTEPLPGDVPLFEMGSDL